MHNGKSLIKTKMLSKLKLIYNCSSRSSLTPDFRNYVRRANPGIGRRLGMFEKEMESNNEPEFDVDELESDFMNVHESHKDFERDMHRYQEQMGVWIVKNKYYKNKQINLLTYSEKEQIRFLHEKDPEEWSAEKLVTSFPATEEAIYKIIKAKWQLRDPDRVKRHDSKVKQNWEDLKKDKIDGIDSELRKHLLKFTNRKVDVDAVPTMDSDPKHHLKLPMGEFSKIISSCKKLEIKSLPQLEETEQSRQYEKDTDSFLLGKVTNKGPITIELFKTQQGIITRTEDNIQATNPVRPETVLGNFNQPEQKVAVPSQFKEEGSNLTQFQENIPIPRKLWRKGATYKLDDCFYDDDGEFLYRVPGMVK